MAHFFSKESVDKSCEDAILLVCKEENIYVAEKKDEGELYTLREYVKETRPEFYKKYRILLE